MEVIPFGSNDADNILQKEPHRAEYLPFGAILLDRQGKILKYNKAEGLIAGRDPDDVLGKNFFSDIAPCAKGKRFHGEFLKFYKTGEINTMFDYEFEYKMKPVKVRIHLKAAQDGQSCWMFVKRL
ncbi:MAG: photoactive yellow protein [Parvularculaceae bacterium]